MGKLIDLDDAIEAIAGADETNGTEIVFSGKGVQEILKQCPTIEERKKGRWKAYVDYGNHRHLLCSCCGEKGYNTRFCSECGAEMETFTETL